MRKTKKGQKAMTRFILIFMMTLLASCDDTDSPNTKTLCEQVADKISECVGGRVPQINSCSQPISEQILSSSCEDVLKIVRGEEL